MRNRLVWLLVLSSVAVCVLSLELAAAQTVPDAAVKAARDYLDRAIGRAKEDSTYFHIMWNVDGVTDFPAILLGEPTAQYLLSDRVIRDFAESKVTEFGQGAKFLSWVFPVFYHDDFIGSLLVGLHDGAWSVGGRALVAKGNRTTPPVLRFMSRVKEEYPPERGYRISTLITDRIGSYVLLYENDKLVKIAQVAPDPEGILGFPADEEGVGLLVSVEQVKERLLELARKDAKRTTRKPDTVRDE